MRRDTIPGIGIADITDMRPALDQAVAQAEPESWRAEAPFILALLAAYLLPLLIVSPGAEIPLIDDWNHALSVQRLVESGELHVSDWTATSLVAQVVWGGLFVTLFGFSFGILRVSTLVLSLIGSLALYALCRQVGITRPRSLMGALLFWVNPLTFGLSYTFMSDVPAVSLQMLATLGYVHGIQRANYRSLFIGSCFAALAFLVRHPGILLPLTVVGFGALDRWPRGVLARRTLASAGVPFLAALVYGVWSQQRGLPDTQAAFFKTVLESGPAEWAKALLLAGYLVIYLGAFLLPLALACGRDGLRILSRGRRNPCRRLLAGWVCIVVGLVIVFAVLGSITSAYTAWMPYLLHGGILQVAGLGPDNLMGDRATVLSTPIRVILTALSAGSLVLIGALLVRRRVIEHRRGRERGAADLLALIALVQFMAIFPVSANLLTGTWLSFDRYFLPLLPPLIVLSLLAVRDVRLSTSLMVAGLSIFMLFSLAATHDWLAFSRLRWELGEELVASGVALEQIDAGMEWDGWYLYERSLECCPEPRTPPDPDRPFWTEIIAQATDSTWVISSSPQEGYRVRERHTYAVWLGREPSVLYVLERRPADAPPLNR